MGAQLKKHGAAGRDGKRKHKKQFRPVRKKSNPKQGFDQILEWFHPIRKWMGGILAAIVTFVGLINLSLPLKVLLAGTVLLLGIGVAVWIVVRDRKGTKDTDQARLRTIRNALFGVCVAFLFATSFKWAEGILTPEDSAAKKIYYVMVLDASDAMREPFDGLPSKWVAVQAALQEFYAGAHQLSHYGLVVIGGQNPGKVHETSLCAMPGAPIIPIGTVSRLGNVRIAKDLTLENLRRGIEPHRPEGGGSLQMAFSQAKNQLELLAPEKVKIIILIANPGDSCRGEIDVNAMIEDFLLANKEIAVHKELVFFNEKGDPGVSSSVQKMNQPEGDPLTFAQEVKTNEELRQSIQNILERLQVYYQEEQPEEATATPTATVTATATLSGRDGFVPLPETNTRRPPTGTSTSTLFATPTSTSTLSATPTFTLTPSLTFAIPTKARHEEEQQPKPDTPLPPKPKPTKADRCGAICNDGTTSSSTGSGTCSSHGGVKQWLYPPKCP